MEIGKRDGKVVWIKKNGEVSKMNVSLNRRLDYLNFPVSGGSNGGVKIIRGEVGKDNLLLVQLFGNNSKYYGKYIMSNLNREKVEIKDHEDFLLEIFDLPDSQIKSMSSIKEFIEEKRDKKRNKVDIEQLAAKKGLSVFDSNSFNGYYYFKGLEEVEFYALPEGWSIIFEEEGALTKKIKEKGLYWDLGNIKHNFIGGICAPLENIKKAFKELDKPKIKYKKKVLQKIRYLIGREFFSIPQEEIDEIIENASITPDLGADKWVYFGDGSLDAAVYAVKVHILNKYTEYDKLIEKGVDRKKALQEVRRDIEEKLEEWSFEPGITIPDDLDPPSIPVPYFE